MTPQEQELLTRNTVNIENLTKQVENIVFELRTDREINRKEHAANRKLLEQYVSHRQFAPWRWAVMTIFAMIIGGAVNAYFSSDNRLEELGDSVLKLMESPSELFYEADTAKYTTISEPS